MNVDAKGRIAIPARFRDQLLNHCEGEMVVTIDTQERCLLIYPQPDWDEIQTRIEALPGFDPAARRVQRLLIGHATDTRMDGNGRILLTPPLREYAQLDRKGVLLGQGRKMELWDESSWMGHRDTCLDSAPGPELSDELRSIRL